MKQFLIHEVNDNVGVAVVDIQAGQRVMGGGLNNGHNVQLISTAIPLGHKIALKDLPIGSTVVKYGEDIGKVVADVHEGEHVHVHNLKTKRWSEHESRISASTASDSSPWRGRRSTCNSL